MLREEERQGEIQSNGGGGLASGLAQEVSYWNPGTWVPKIGPITQGPIIGTEYIGTLIRTPSLIYIRPMVSPWL